jgi:hypothetical protein
MKSKKKIQTRKIQTRKMTKIKKNPYTKKKRLYIGGAESRPGFTEKLINRTLLLIEGLIIESIDQLGYSIGIDVSNPEQVNAKLEEIKVIISDPEINEKVRIIVGKISVLLSVALEAAQPYVKPMAEKLNDIYVKSTSDLGRSTISILKNIAKAIPVYGAIVALIDAGNTITETAANTVTAKEHAKSAVDDAIREIADDFKNLLKQKKDLLSRIPTEVPVTQPTINP